jgi:acyl-CoA synthetase (AMP-forming)/AMP-acid ligase II
MRPTYVLRELSRYNIGTYADIIYRNALLYAEENAFKCGDQSLTFAGFNADVNRLINALNAMGVKKGEALGILSWNNIEYVSVYGAAMKGGFVASPFNPRLKIDELEEIINYSQVRVLFVGPELMESLVTLRPRLRKDMQLIGFKNNSEDSHLYRDLMDHYPASEPEILVEKEDPAFIFYTSGTTGLPKGALYTQYRAIEDTQRAVISLGLQPEDRQIQVMPLFHIGGAKNLWAYFFVGAGNVIMPHLSFDPRATLRAIQEEKATDIHIVPTHLAAFLNLPDVDRYDLSKMKRMFYAASPMPLELLKRGIEKWGSIFVQGYGATEDGPNVLFLSRRQHELMARPDAEKTTLAPAGFPHIGVHVRIVDANNQDVAPGEIGEIIVQSHSIMKEWWRNPETTQETIIDGWVHTGDLGRYDEKGFTYIVDRKKDMIISGGENIYPREIEEVLYQHPAILEAAVIGIPDPFWVEVGQAVIVLKEGETLTSEEVIRFCKDRLAHFKAPKSVMFVDTLPKSPAGKILKRELHRIAI